MVARGAGHDLEPRHLAEWLDCAEMPTRSAPSRVKDVTADPVAWLYLSPLRGYERPALLDIPYAVN